MLDQLLDSSSVKMLIGTVIGSILLVANQTSNINSILPMFLHYAILSNQLLLDEI